MGADSLHGWGWSFGGGGGGFLSKCLWTSASVFFTCCSGDWSDAVLCWPSEAATWDQVVLFRVGKGHVFISSRWTINNAGEAYKDCAWFKTLLPGFNRPHCSNPRSGDLRASHLILRFYFQPWMCWLLFTSEICKLWTPTRLQILHNGLLACKDFRLTQQPPSNLLYCPCAAHCWSMTNMTSLFIL